MKFIYSQGKQLPCGLISRASSTIADKVLAFMARRFLAQHLVHSSLLPGTFMLAQGLVYSTSLYFAHWDSLFFFFPSDCSADSVDISPVLWTILRVSNFPLRWCFFRIEVTSGIELSSIVSLEFHISGFTQEYETSLEEPFLSLSLPLFLTTWPATTKAYTSPTFYSFRVSKYKVISFERYFFLPKSKHTKPDVSHPRWWFHGTHIR